MIIQGHLTWQNLAFFQKLIGKAGHADVG